MCLNAQKRGWHTCPSKSVPAEEIEGLVIEQIRSIGRDPTLIAATIRRVRKQATEQIDELEREETRLQRELKRSHRELRTVVADPGTTDGSTASQLGDLNERIRGAEQRLTEVTEQITELRHQMVGEDEIAQSLAAFDPVWEMLSPKEQARIVRLLIERVAYDGEHGKLSLTFRPSGLRTVCDEMAAKEVAA